MRKKEFTNSNIDLKLVDESTLKFSKSANDTLNFIARLIIVFMMSFGALFTFLSMMNISYIDWMIYVFIAVFSIIFTVLYRNYKKHILIMSVGIAVSLVALLIMYNTSVIGFQAIYDSIIKSIYDSMTWTAPKPILNDEVNTLFNTTYCIIAIAVALTAVVSYFVVAKIQFIGAFLITFVFFEFGAAFGCVPDKIPFAILLSAWAAALVLHISNRQHNVVKYKRFDKTENIRRYTYKDKNSRFSGSAVFMATAIFLCFVIIASILDVSGFSRSDNIIELRHNIKSTALDLYDRVTGFDHDASLKDGNLAVLGDRKVLNRHYATLKIKDINQDIYLKGFTGNVYLGDSWTNLTDKDYDEIKEFKKYLNDRDFTLATVSGDLLDYDLNNNGLERVEVKLSDLRREKDYLYSLNGAVSSVSVGGYQDIYLTSDDTEEYSYNAYYNKDAYIKIPYTTSFNDKEFQSYWKQYVDFVQKKYTLLPEGIDDVARLASGFKGDTVFSTIDNIRNFLNDNTEYSDRIAKLPNGKEFSSYFIFDTGYGYSAHYATASAVMLRALGVPARYVEGFYISNDQLKKSRDADGEKIVEITDGNYHAWLEIFDGSYGWIPVEVTKGFYTGSFEKYFQNIKSRAEKANRQNKNKDKKDNKDSNGAANVVKDKNRKGNDVIDEKLEPIVNETTQYKESNIYIYLSIVFGIIVLLIISLILVLIFRRHSIIVKRRKIFNSDNYRNQVVLSFELLFKLLKFNNIEFDKIYSYNEFKSILENSIEFEDKEISIDKVLKIYEKTLFSKYPVFEDEAKEVMDFIDDFGYEVYSNLTFFKRLKFKFINVLS